MPAPSRPALIVLAAALAGACPAQPQTPPRSQPGRGGAPAPGDALAPTWAWLRDAPRLGKSAAAQKLGPGQEAFDGAIRSLDPRDPRPLVGPALAARLEGQLAQLEPQVRAPLIEGLAAEPALASEVALLLDRRDDIPAAYAVLAALLDAHGERVAELAPLAAAICAVHDKPVERRVNENTVTLIEPAQLFGYYAANERAMHFPPGATPAELLVYVADATGSVAELDWARDRYGRDRNVGNRYQEITYDTRALKQGAEKRVTAAGGYTLQSIRENGGVCADQAYFAETVAKAAGIPACYVRGRGGEASHAWVGYLEQAGRRSARWNFTEGRYKEYEDVQGKVRDPQSGEMIADAFLTVEALTGSATPEQRRQSVALADAAARVTAMEWDAGGDRVARGSTSRQLDLLEASLRLNPGNLEAWRMARDVVCTPAATLEQKQRWTRAVDQLAGASSPDFAFEILRPIFASEQDPGSRFALWGWAAGRFQSRPDLAAEARLEQTQAMLAQGRREDAVAGARAVFEEFSDVGPVAVRALALAEGVLTDLGRGAEAVGMYEQAFRKLRQPGRMSQVFLVQTSWYQVGSRYAELLDASGDGRKAETVRRRLAP